MTRAADLTGQVFAMLTILGDASTRTRRRRVHVRCACGVEKEADASQIKAGLIKSCGCLRRSEACGGHLRHGESRRRDGRSASPEFVAWSGAIQRCTDANNPKYSRYGGRGITVCDRWRESFEAFLADMGRKPSPHHSIDRIDVNGHYEPGNCRWADLKEQARNKQTSVMLTCGGETLHIAEWAERLGVKRSMLADRVRRGWSDERTVTTPRLDH